MCSLITFSGVHSTFRNFFMNLLVERSEQKKDLPRLYAFSTFFFPNLAKKGFSSVRRWTKKVDIFSKDMLIVPVHLTMHWCLCVSCNLTDQPKASNTNHMIPQLQTVDFKQKELVYYDSMGGDNERCLS